MVTSGDANYLGFASDNRRAKVALTRARSCLIVVADGNMINNNQLGDESKRKYLLTY